MIGLPDAPPGLFGLRVYSSGGNLSRRSSCGSGVVLALFPFVPRRRLSAGATIDSGQFNASIPLNLKSRLPIQRLMIENTECAIV